MTALHIHARDADEALRIACDRALSHEWVHLCPDGWVDIDDERTSPVAPVLGSFVTIPMSTPFVEYDHGGFRRCLVTMAEMRVQVATVDPDGSRISWWSGTSLCWCRVADLNRKAG